MVTALVPVDGSARAFEAVKHAIRLVREKHSYDIHLLHVQPVLAWYLRAFVSRRSINTFRLDEAHTAFEPACQLLDQEGIPYTKHIFVGDVATVIAECACELRCDTVVMGTHGFGTVAQFFLGSVSHRTIHKMDARIPITLVKANSPVPKR